MPRRGNALPPPRGCFKRVHLDVPRPAPTRTQETIPEVHRHPTLVSTFEAVELACIVAFTIEYLVRVATCARRPAAVAAGTPALRATLSYVLGVMPLVDLVSILPYYIGIFLDSGGSLAVLRVLRMARVFRVFRAGSLAKDMHMLSDSLSRGKDGALPLLQASRSAGR